MVDLGNKKKSVVDTYESIKTECQEQTAKMKALEVKITKLDRARYHLKTKHNELSSTNEPDAINVQQMVSRTELKNLTTYLFNIFKLQQNELADLKKAIEERNIVGQKIEEDIEKLKGSINEKEAELERIKTIVRGYEDRIDPLNVHITYFKFFSIRIS